MPVCLCACVHVCMCVCVSLSFSLSHHLLSLPLSLIPSLCLYISGSLCLLAPHPSSMTSHPSLPSGLQPEAWAGGDALLVPAPQGPRVGVSVPEQPPGRGVKMVPAQTAPTLPVFPAQPHPGLGLPLPWDPPTLSQVGLLEGEA